MSDKPDNVEQFPTQAAVAPASVPASAAAPAVEASKELSISMDDIAAVVQLIDICSRRGSFEGKELTPVGNLRGKFEAFLKFVEDKQKAQAPAAPAQA